MAKFDSPFLVGLIYAFQSKTELFFVMPFMPGTHVIPTKPSFHIVLYSNT
jgi:hypothetical protein